jgi:uncharacterized membrane protein
MAEINGVRELKERELDDILALSDGVSALAITLLVLGLVVPAFGSMTSQCFPAY